MERRGQKETRAVREPARTNPVKRKREQKERRRERWKEKERKVPKRSAYLAI
jgi:hypothetical protein